MVTWFVMTLVVAFEAPKTVATAWGRKPAAELSHRPSLAQPVLARIEVPHQTLVEYRDAAQNYAVFHVESRWYPFEIRRDGYHALPSSKSGRPVPHPTLTSAHQVINDHWRMLRELPSR
jgi:hypothetical protein